MGITLYWVNPVIWTDAYQQIIGSLTRIAGNADPEIFLKLSIFDFLKSQWGIQCYRNFPLFSTKTHSLTLLQELLYHLRAAGAQK